MALPATNLSEFLAQIGLVQVEDLLISEDVDMSVLPLLDDADLKELGLSLGQRKRLRKGLDALTGLDQTTTSIAESAGGNPIQLRRLSVLFCDMIGSTELGERLDIDEMQLVLQHYYDIADTVAERHSGLVASAQGDGLVILFGYPRVLDGFAERCIRAAQDLQKALSETPIILEGQHPIHIETRIGIASGQAAVGFKHSEQSRDHMHLVGPVVNRAARLQTVARPCSIAVDPKTRHLTERAVLYSDPEQHQLKGLSEPVDVFHVVGLHQTLEALSAPVALIGRDSETSALMDIWSLVQQGQAATVTLTGDAGIGKSALIQSFVAARLPASVRLLRLRCTIMDAQSPLRPVANALSALTRSGETEKSLAGLLGNAPPELIERAAQLLEIEGRSPDGAVISASERDAILDVLTDWLVTGSDTPTVVIVENAQWIDDSTSALLAKTASQARAQSAPLLLLAITRDETEDVWSGQPGHTRLSLSKLDQSQASELLNRLLDGTPVPQSVKDNILYHADGNPLMLETLAYAQVQHRLPEVADAIEVPQTIYESVSKRLDTIRSGRGVIEALAVLGAPASRGLVSAVVGTDIQTIDSALKALERAGLIERVFDGGEKIGIRHKAYRDVIYEQIDGRSRKALHRAAYNALRNDPHVRTDILAGHAQAAQDWKHASVHALDAATVFLNRSALVEAGHFFDIANGALKRLPTSPSVNRDRLRATTGLASVERSRFGISTDTSAELGQQAVEIAREIGDTHAELLALNGLYSHALVRADYPKAYGFAQAMLSTAEQCQNKTFVMIGTRAIGAVALHRGDQDTAVRSLSQALNQYDRKAHLQLAYAHGYDHAEICAALLSMSLWISGDLRRSRRLSTFSIDHSKEIDHAHSIAQAISFRVMLGALARHGSELSRIGSEGREVAEKHGIHVMRAAARLFPFATQLCLHPAPPTASQLAELRRRVTDFRAANPFNYGPLLATVLADVYLQAGDVDAAEAELSDGEATEAKTGETWTSAEVRRMQARVAAARGQHDHAARLRSDALDRAHQTQAATIALRITCDMAEADPGADTRHAIQTALSQLVSHDENWDIKRAKTLLQTGSDT